jgi:hypothetical protein
MTKFDEDCDRAIVNGMLYAMAEDSRMARDRAEKETEASAQVALLALSREIEKFRVAIYSAFYNRPSEVAHRAREEAQ